MTTLLELRTAVARDIHDPLFSTFSEADVDDFINAGQADINRAYPLEGVDILVPVVATYSYDTVLTEVFRVEMLRNNLHFVTLQQSTGDLSQDGWDYFATQLHFAEPTIDNCDPDTDTFSAWGYQPRVRLTSDAQVIELDTDAEYAVRTYARWACFQNMLSDRALFKQWQGASQNTDISVNQLEQMVTIYSREWDRTRSNLRRLRRR